MEAVERGYGVDWLAAAERRYIASKTVRWARTKSPKPGSTTYWPKKLHRDRIATEALGVIDEDTVWVEIPHRGCRAADICLEDGTRAVVVHSDGRARRDVARTAEIVTTAEAKLRALELRVRAGRLADPAKIGAATQRILGAGGVGRLFDVEIGKGQLLYHYNEDAHAYEQWSFPAFVESSRFCYPQGGL